MSAKGHFEPEERNPERKRSVPLPAPHRIHRLRSHVGKAHDIFEPLLVVRGPLAPSVGHLTGVGPGRGIALMYLLTGILLVIHTAQSLHNRRLTQVEAELPDVDILLQEI